MGFGCGGTLNAFSLDPEGRNCCIVGREVLKVVQIYDDKVKERLNLRVGKINLNYSSVDVAWHPMERK